MRPPDRLARQVLRPADKVEWERPWFTPLRRAGRAVAAGVHAGQPVWQALDAQGIPASGRTAGPRFVTQECQPVGEAYEAFIFRTGQVPTRDNLHDFFNGLIWLHYPQAKRRLNALQAGAIAAQGVGAVRGPLRDAITVFDENGAVLFAPRVLRDALAARAWRRLFTDLRPLWRQARLEIFGHALLEQLAAPRKPLTAHVLLVPDAPEAVADIDGWLEGRLEPELLKAKPFTPLPVLGVPGWWAENENFSFYDDSSVFRSARPASQYTTGASPR
ncbi:DUF3025 domain-containing protein [Paracidovorax citrulli]|uniref:DUF3025 domain-containing protein n=1 Tax=Paracidovorax citrulli TaxID=80869 RepID=UPI0006625F2E|nr:DUF3025 domain-containing protein [Paracidovorax citrulli]QCX10219.1 hypothetical protein APS58_1319 [Paracidovorax citrulli]UEG46790.1 DUF3025 domain-containing protein [Paracidovorax citrulli]UMT89957.1 DUF3025 domain-containing protein [Paracidovorax citrulli]UMT93994.1 DUF3025 domain-containing protein [Paracidovorax citrulli]WIY35253.1 DUF3025 domain-containing protein [Paracidovorax citrulli]